MAKQHIDDNKAFIKGLTSDLLDEISSPKRASANPELIYQDNYKFMWKILGKRVYRVEVSIPANFDITFLTKEEQLSELAQITYSCTCPDAFKRQNNQVDKKFCKHAHACLLTLVDDVSEVRSRSEKRAKTIKEVEESKLAFLRLRQEEEEQRKREAEVEMVQQAKLPGERERILYGMKMLGSGKVLQMIEDKIKESLANLELLVQLFPERDMPTRKEASCFRCGIIFDPHYASRCQKPHPEACVNIEACESSNQYNYQFSCTRCKRVWLGDESRYFEYVDDKRGSCFVGEHCTSKEAYERENWPGST